MMSRSSNFRPQRSNRDNQLDEILNPQEFNANGGRENRFRDNDNDQLNVTSDLTSQSGSGRDWCLREDDEQGIFLGNRGPDGGRGQGRRPREEENDELIIEEPLSLIGDDDQNSFIGTSLDDTFLGNGGNDILYGSYGSDTFDGGVGIDTVDYSSMDTPTIIGTAGTIYKGVDGVDLVRDVETIIGAEGQINSIDASGTDPNSTASIFVDLAIGKLTVNDIPFIGSLTFSTENFQNAIGSNNDDILIGNNQSNELIGGAGNDKISGGLGPNFLTGGTGADTFIFNGGNDTITDFNFTDGDLIDVETQYSTIQQTGNDTILDFDTGGQITLIGIEQADIQMDWFM